LEIIVKNGVARILALVVLFVASMPLVASAAPCDTKSAAWYVSSGKDIESLQNIGFNLFFYNATKYEGMSVQARDAFIEEGLSRLDGCSQLVLPIDVFLSRNWFDQDGMEAFVIKWGSNPKVYGFLLKDDVTTAPFPSEDSVNPNALWIYRWYYRMIRNTAEDQFNSYHRDIAPGKKVIVTLPFQLLDARGDYVGNPVKIGFHFAIRYTSVPPNFFVPGDAWDVVMPYWYPHRRQIEQKDEGYIMDVLYKEMATLFPASAMIPIVQTAADVAPSELSSENFFSLEHDGLCEENDGLHGYDLSIQYGRFLKYGLITNANKAVAYYSANGHATVCDNLLHVNCMWDDNPSSNPYYAQAARLNVEHFRLFGQ